MKKTIFYLLFTALTCKFSFAQTQRATGNVKNSQGQPVSFAFIRDLKTNYATFSDTLGNFSIQVVKGTDLLINGRGYEPLTIPVQSQNTMIVTLKGGSLISNVADDNSIDISKLSFGTRANMYTAEQGRLAVTSHQEATRGSRYLLNTWGHGFLIDNRDSLVQDKNYLFNYDKMNGDLLLTQDKNNIMSLDKSQVKKFILFDNRAYPYVFVYVPSIDSKHYVRAIATGSRYSIYKVLGTHLEKANYATNGISSTGNNYDEYIDEGTYYVTNNDGIPKKLQLKKKSIKEIFATDIDKVQKYLSVNSGEITDTYLANLGQYLNNE